MNADYDPELTVRENLVKQRQYYMVTVAKLERALDQSFENAQELHGFIEVFKNRYPHSYEDIVQEYGRKLQI